MQATSTLVVFPYFHFPYTYFLEHLLMASKEWGTRCFTLALQNNLPFSFFSTIWLLLICVCFNFVQKCLRNISPCFKMICGLRHSRSAPKKEIRHEISWVFFKTGLIFTPEVFIFSKNIWVRGPGAMNFDINYLICCV